MMKAPYFEYVVVFGSRYSKKEFQKQIKEFCIKNNAHVEKAGEIDIEF